MIGSISTGVLQHEPPTPTALVPGCVFDHLEYPRCARSFFGIGSDVGTVGVRVGNML